MEDYKLHSPGDETDTLRKIAALYHAPTKVAK